MASDRTIADRLRSAAARWRKAPRGGVRALADDPSLAVPFGYAPLPAEGSVALVLHLFHAEMAQEFHALAQSLGPACDILITTDTQAKADGITACFADWERGEVAIRLVENRGRDVLPKLTAFADRYGRYEQLLFLHSKKTDFSPLGRGWRQLLTDGLCGSPEVVASIREIFAVAPEIGIVFPQHHEPIRRHLNWGGNFTIAQRLAQRMGVTLDPDGTLEFPSGSMFWARPAALAPLLALGLRADDFPPEAGQTDGTTAHAVERLFLLAGELAGFAWCKVAAPEHYAERDGFLEVRSRDELIRALAELDHRIVPTMVRPWCGT